MFRHFKAIVFLLFILVSEYSLGQLVIEGVLLDSQSQEPVSYATIGIPSLGIGTVSNEDGSFKLVVNDSLSKESIHFSNLAYKSRVISISQILKLKEKIIYLNEQTTELESVVITDKGLSRPKRKVLGNRQFNTGTMRLDQDHNGGAMALLITHNKAPFTIFGAKLWITYNSLPSFKIRVRFMNVDPVTGMPGEDIMEENVILESDIKKGWLDINLVKNNVRIQDQEFFLVFEWIMDSNDRKILASQVSDYLNQSPEALSAGLKFTGEELVTEQIIEDFRSGVWFGSLIHPVIGKDLKSYYRLNAYDDWKPSAAKLTSTVTLFE